jgi:hypothetical protein
MARYWPLIDCDFLLIFPERSRIEAMGNGLAVVPEEEIEPLLVWVPGASDWAKSPLPHRTRCVAGLLEQLGKG